MQCTIDAVRHKLPLMRSPTMARSDYCTRGLQACVAGCAEAHAGAMKEAAVTLDARKQRVRARACARPTRARHARPSERARTDARAFLRAHAPTAAQPRALARRRARAGARARTQRRTPHALARTGAVPVASAAAQAAPQAPQPRVRLCAPRFVRAGVRACAVRACSGVSARPRARARVSACERALVRVSARARVLMCVGTHASAREGTYAWLPRVRPPARPPTSAR